MTLIPDTIPYLPLLDLKPAEMAALQELPEKDKEILFPAFKLKAWVGSNDLARSLERLEKAYGKRPAILELSEVDLTAQRRHVHEELDALRNPENGYQSWVRYLNGPAISFVPSLYLNGPIDQVTAQAISLYGLGRGVCVRFDRETIPFAVPILDAIKRIEQSGTSFIFIVDVNTTSLQFVASDAVLAGNCMRQIIERFRDPKVVLASSSFPVSFVGLASQEIIERRLHSIVQSAIGRPIIYSDHASARVEVQRGGGGVPAPRIDYAGANRWTFFRDESDSEDRAICYSRQAYRCIQSEVWDARLMIWGKQMIERTAYGDENAISSPPKATAARINMHLHQQLFYGNPDGLYDTDEAWSE